MNYLNIKIKLVFAENFSDELEDEKFSVSLFDNEKRSNNSNQTRRLNSYLHTYDYPRNFDGDRERFKKFKRASDGSKKVCLRDILSNNTLFEFKSVDRWLKGMNLTRKFVQYYINKHEFNYSEADLVRLIKLLKELKSSRKHATKSLNFRRLMKTQAIQGNYEYSKTEYHKNFQEREVEPYSESDLECLTVFVVNGLKLGWEPKTRKDHEDRLLEKIDDTINLFKKNIQALSALSKEGAYLLVGIHFEEHEDRKFLIIHLRTPLNIIFDAKQFIKIYKTKTTKLIKNFKNIEGENPFQDLFKDSVGIWSPVEDSKIEITYGDDLYQDIAS